jgi:hypothetical protein
MAAFGNEIVSGRSKLRETLGSTSVPRGAFRDFLLGLAGVTRSFLVFDTYYWDYQFCQFGVKP